jgi:hypothetical protein
MNVNCLRRNISTRSSSHAHLTITRWLIDIGVKIILGTIHELSLQGFGGYAHLITTRCLLCNLKLV